MAKYRSTQSGADLTPSQAVRLYARTYQSWGGFTLRDAEGRRRPHWAPFAVLSRSEYRQLLVLLNSPQSLADGPADVD